MRQQVRKYKRPDIQMIEILKRKEKCCRGNYQKLTKNSSRNEDKEAPDLRSPQHTEDTKGNI